jgi:anthranilate phosphoribosyltransferase
VSQVPHFSSAILLASSARPPVVNPASAPNQVVGVFAREWQEPMVDVLRLLGSKRVMSVHADGLDELSIGGSSRVVELIDDEIHSYTLSPSDVGLTQHALDSLKADSIESSLQLIFSALDESNIAARDIVALNAGASIYVSGLAKDISQGVELALNAIASGQALQKWEALATLTTSLNTSGTKAEA